MSKEQNADFQKVKDELLKGVVGGVMPGDICPRCHVGVIEWEFVPLRVKCPKCDWAQDVS